MTSHFSRQQFKIALTVATILYCCIQIPLHMLRIIRPSSRAHPRWTYRQALGREILKIWFTYASTVEFRFPLSLDAGSEKERFVKVHPETPELYRGMPDIPNCEIKPTTIGGVWYPQLFRANQHKDMHIILHFHGGAYVLGSSRQSECGFAADTLHKATSALMFFPQYRLASTQNCGFPAALQDAISSYAYLLDLGILPSRITISGDSAGGHLAISLLRYISENRALLPRPLAALLWSPWLDLASDPKAIDLSINARFDFVISGLVTWAIRVFAPPTVDLSHPYLSPLRHPFETQTAIWIQVGGLEVLNDDTVAFFKSMKRTARNKIELYEVPYAPHDIFLAGNILGFEREATDAAAFAQRFLKYVEY